MTQLRLKNEYCTNKILPLIYAIITNLEKDIFNEQTFSFLDKENSSFARRLLAFWAFSVICLVTGNIPNDGLHLSTKTGITKVNERSQLSLEQND